MWIFLSAVQNGIYAGTRNEADTTAGGNEHPGFYTRVCG